MYQMQQAEHCTLPCARSIGQPVSQCEFGVARAGGGYATVVIKKPDGRTRTIFFRMGTPNIRCTKKEDFAQNRSGLAIALLLSYLYLFLISYEQCRMFVTRKSNIREIFIVSLHWDVIKKYGWVGTQ